MCGIVGYFGIPGGIDQSTLLACRDALESRGPDDAGCWISGDRRVALAHRRLSILDLTSAGSQPMLSADGLLAIVFNGEIYNHGHLRNELHAMGYSFRGRSDTEVILNAYRQWGTNCLERLRGMFAMAVYDARNGRMMLARDRAGEKPLYWAHHRGGIMFASELKALFADPVFARDLDPKALDFYLAFGYVPGEQCLVNGVRKIPSACFMEVSLDGTKTGPIRYWHLPQPDPDTCADEEELVDELHAILQGAVREQLEADVPVAVLLSGGTDSSLVTACAAAGSGKQVNTYTVGFPGNADFDERRHAAFVATHFGTRHTELAVEQDAVDLLPRLAMHIDEPIADSSIIPTFLLSQLVSRHGKVVLGGDGGDELFGGYRAYQGAILVEQWRQFLPSIAREAMAGIGKRLPSGFRNRNALAGLGGSVASGVAHIGVMFYPDERMKIAPWLRDTAAMDMPASWKASLVEPSRGVPGVYMAADFSSYLVEDLLVKVDRASMANSLEVRAPFLDVRLVEFAFRKVPNRFRATRYERKVLLRRLAKRILPAGFDASRKQGFSIPLAAWMAGDQGRNLLDEVSGQYKDIFDFTKISDLLRSRRIGSVSRGFGLLVLMYWMRAHRISIGTASPRNEELA